jgi:hypothetical protein
MPLDMAAAVLRCVLDPGCFGNPGVALYMVLPSFFTVAAK